MKKGDADHYDAKIGARVRERRFSLGVSQSTLAEGLGISFQQVQKMERGTNRIGCGRIVRIAEILHTPVHYFFEGMGPCSEPK